MLCAVEYFDLVVQCYFCIPQNKLALPDDRQIFSFEQEGIIELRKEPEVAVAII